MSSTPRIATFDEWVPFHIGTVIKEPMADDPINWSEFTRAPKFEKIYDNGGIREYILKDNRAIDEIHRLLKFATCPICKSKMMKREQDFNETLLVCLRCGFWGGRGSRMDNVHESIPLRGVLGIYKPLQPLKDLDTQNLVSHLKKHPADLPKIDPRRAESFVIDLIGNYLDCEVRPIGGTKDKGVDGYVIKNDEIKSIIQVKWRESTNGAESVKVVREVAGTLLARGIPSGILVSNRDHFSPDAVNDAGEIAKRKIEGLGQMELSLFDYHTVLDMLEISNTKLTENMKVEDWVHIEYAYDVFEGAARLPEEFVNMFL